MKTYLQYIREYRAQDINDELMVDDRIITPEITEQDLIDAGWGSSFNDDRSWIVIDKTEYHKIKDDTWQGLVQSSSSSITFISSEKLFKLIQKNKSDKGYKGEIYKNNPRKVIL